MNAAEWMKAPLSLLRTQICVSCFSLLLSVTQVLEGQSQPSETPLRKTPVLHCLHTKQVAWIIDARADRARPHMARTYQSHTALALLASSSDTFLCISGRILTVV